MRRVLLHDAFARHVWATLRLIDSCGALNPQQLVSEVPGAYGSILATFRHLVGADSSYLHVLSGENVPRPDVGDMGLPELRAVMERNAIAWSSVIGEDLDPESSLKARSRSSRAGWSGRVAYRTCQGKCRSP